jgi:hypothetical protein
MRNRFRACLFHRPKSSSDAITLANSGRSHTKRKLPALRLTAPWPEEIPQDQAQHRGWGCCQRAKEPAAWLSLLPVIPPKSFFPEPPRAGHGRPSGGSAITSPVIASPCTKAPGRRVGRGAHVIGRANDTGQCERDIRRPTAREEIPASSRTRPGLSSSSTCNQPRTGNAIALTGRLRCAECQDGRCPPLSGRFTNKP